MIDNLKKIIDKQELEVFKQMFKKQPLNNHQKTEVFKYAFFKQKQDFIDYLFLNMNVSNEILEDIFIQSNAQNIDIKDTTHLKKLNDMSISQKIKDQVNFFIKSKNEEFLLFFSEQYPVSTFLNFNKIIFHSFSHKKLKFIESFSKKPLNVENIFYIGLCCVKFENKDLFNKILENQISIQHNILEQLKNYSDLFYRSKSTIVSKNQIDEFIDKNSIISFASFLQNNIEVQENKVKKAIHKI